eukprot:358859-Chlamydomonas_euryale.AAC.16
MSTPSGCCWWKMTQESSVGNGGIPGRPCRWTLAGSSRPRGAGWLPLLAAWPPAAGCWRLERSRCAIP